MKGLRITGRCHIVPNHLGSIYEMDEDGRIMVCIRQIVTWYENGVQIQDIRELLWETDYMDLRACTCIPGNIEIELSTTSPTSDPEFGLWWQDDKVMRNDVGQALYRQMRYDMDSKYQLYNELQKVNV